MSVEKIMRENGGNLATDARSGPAHKVEVEVLRFAQNDTAPARRELFRLGDYLISAARLWVGQSEGR